MQSLRLIVVRHGETDWNAVARIQGQIDIGLNDKGRWQAGRLAQALADEPVDAIYSSDLARAHQTADAVARVTGVAITPTPGLRERVFGNFEGKTFAEIDALWPEQAQAWRKRVPDFAPEGGESLLQFQRRVLGVVQTLVTRHAEGQILLVAHGGVMDLLYRAATGQELQAPRTWLLGNAAINRLLHTPSGLTLVGWADTQHLDDAALDEAAA
ncbi:MAG: histidine phosphatase family protein [Pseudomonadota bacterium]